LSFLSSFILGFAFGFYNPPPFSFSILIAGEGVQQFLAVSSVSFSSTLFPAILVPYELPLAFYFRQPSDNPLSFGQAISFPSQSS
jgi:hypothetical protein